MDHRRLLAFFYFYLGAKSLFQLTTPMPTHSALGRGVGQTLKRLTESAPNGEGHANVKT